MSASPTFIYFCITFFILIYATYKLFSKKGLESKWMMTFSIIIAIFPFSLLAILSGGMGLFGLFDMRLLKQHGVLYHLFVVAWYLGGPVGFIGFMKTLLGHQGIGIYWMLVYGLISYVGLILLFIKGMIVECSFTEFYYEALNDENTLILFSVATLGVLYVCFTLWVWSWQVMRMYKLSHKEHL